ncbi:MAG: isocitrate dehydrogenase kinase/phosphatase [Pseudohongiellaceae bacterium]|jgi:isocitrate dehydrogenase kinase/phosphatase
MSTSRQLARTILNGFHSMFADFQNITLGARARFEQQDWKGVQQAQADRLEIYKAKVDQLLPLLRNLAGDHIHNLATWQKMRQDYGQLIGQYSNFEIAESFYNSVFCKVFAHQHITNDYAFVLSSRCKRNTRSELAAFSSYKFNGQIKELVAKILSDYEFSTPFSDLAFDVSQITRNVIQQLVGDETRPNNSITVDVLEPIFYRNKGAYLVGRINGVDENPAPFVLPFLYQADGTLYIDTLITDPDEVSVIFSFTRSYFMVDSAVPVQIVEFLHGVMPHKKLYELYASIGFRKHAKTDFFRDFMAHLDNSDDPLIIAPGIKGMVMSVFVLPSYDIVFKIIKDKFTPPKEVTKKIVKEKYQLVTKHDRAGRMADTQEFNAMRFPKNRFSTELIEELQKVAPSQLTITDTEIIIEHLYTERRMEPLNLYLRTADDQQIINVMDEYGNAIKQLAAANIFPGDMLLKNFGVTRHGRVVFYDYDEICHLTECNFRIIPHPRNEQEEMASTPWYAVKEFDIFPEEFRLFFSGNPKAKKAFDDLHGDLYDVQTWQDMQNQIIAGQVVDVFPYRQRKRFTRQLP